MKNNPDTTPKPLFLLCRYFFERIRDLRLAHPDEINPEVLIKIK